MIKLCSPQLEDGHTRIANELLQALYKYPFSGIELQVILVIIRNTYGWMKKQTHISYGELAEEIGADKRYIKRVINKLVKDRVILKDKDNNKNILGLNKHYLNWRLWITLKSGDEKDTTVVAKTPPE